MYSDMKNQANNANHKHHDEHGHQHGHHHHHVHAPQSMNAVFIFSIVLNLLFVLVEAGVGLYEHSLSLLSDAGHNLSDVFSLLLVLIAFRLVRVRSTARFSYGLKKSTVLISLLNAIILLVAIGAIYIESIHKLMEPTEVNGVAVSWTAFIGILINGATAWLLLRGQKDDINVRGAFLHMLADTLVSVGVVISGIIITYTNLNIVDPIVSIIIATIILHQTWGLLRESIVLSVDGTPESIDAGDIEQLMLSTVHVAGVHHIHIWAISTTSNALTAHIVVDDLSHLEEVRHQLKHLLADHHIAHSTLEFETAMSECHDSCCE
jgi:cobalt-zinc-cadmium efflux system protein